MTRLIGLAGRKRSGKDTVGAMIYDSAPDKWFVMAFATKLKEICADVYGFTTEQIYGGLKEVPDPRYPRPDGTCLTPREAMEKCGTEWARSCYPDTWADAGPRLAERKRAMQLNVVIVDCRFVNEGKRIIAQGGEVWRIYRESADAVPATHQAEKEMDTFEFDELVTRRLSNNGTLEELRETVRAILGATVKPELVPSGDPKFPRMCSHCGAKYYELGADASARAHVAWACIYYSQSNPRSTREDPSPA